MHHYQDFSVSHIVAHPAAGLFQEMGLGKTVSTLTAIDILMFDMFEIKKPLIIAPLNVAKYT